MTNAPTSSLVIEASVIVASPLVTPTVSTRIELATSNWPAPSSMTPIGVVASSPSGSVAFAAAIVAFAVPHVRPSLASSPSTAT
jgi:hypothetical protein